MADAQCDSLIRIRPHSLPPALDDVAEILFTSGATGEPKGVTITHRNILANLKPIDAGIEKYRKYMGPFEPIRFLNLLPLSHLFGQTMAAFIPPMIAGEVFFMSGYNPRDAAHLIRKRRISVLVCVPQMLELLRDYIVKTIPEANAPARSRKWYRKWWQYRRIHRRLGWKFWSFVVGAAPLDPALEEFWGKLGYVVIQGYGLTRNRAGGNASIILSIRAGGRWGSPSRVSRSGLHPTAKCCCAEKTLRLVISAKMYWRKARSAIPKAGCIPAISGNWIPKTASKSLAARKK